MAKVKNPLFSGDVSGAFGKKMIFRRGGVVTRMFSPRNPNTAAQQAVRQAFKEFSMPGLTQEQADLLYAAILHQHDDLYSPLSHLHDDRYSQLAHTHEAGGLDGDQLSLDVVADVPGYVLDKAVVYFSDEGLLSVRMKLGANEKTVVLASLQTTIELQLAADTMLVSSNATTNYASNAQIWIGENNAAVETARAWIKPDFTGIPEGVAFVSAKLKLTPVQDLATNARTMYAHRCLRDVVVTQATWNIWKTGSNWGAAGCSDSANDYDGAVVLGSMSQPAAPTLNTPIEMTLSASELQKLFDGTYTNNGIILFVETQSADMVVYASKDNATAAYRPVIEIVYF